MKRVFSLFFAINMVFAIFSGTATANSLQSVNLVHAFFDKLETRISLSGTAENCRESTVFIYVIPALSDEPDISELGLGKQLVTAVPLDNSGSFSADITLPDTLPGGNFVVTAYCDGARDTYYFSYINMNTLNTIASLLTPGITSSGVENVLDDYLNELLIEETYFNKIKGTVCSVLSSLCGTGYTGDRFYATLTQATGAYELSEGTDLKTVFNMYLADILDYDGDFLALSADVRADVETALRTADYTEADFATIYFNTVSVFTLKNAANYTVVRDYILDNHEALGIDTSSYNSKTPYAKDTIMQKVYANVSSVNKVTDIKSIFDSAVSGSGSTSSGNNSSKFPGGGSGALSSSSSSVSFSPTQSIKEPEVTAPSVFLSDISGHWAEFYILQLCENGIISGYEDGTFRPENNVSRAEFSKLVSALLRGEYTKDTEFSDVTSSDWFEPYVSRLAAAKIITGYNGMFNPYAFISREDAAVIIFRLLGASGISAEGEASFADSSNISDYAKQAVAALASMNILNGYDNKCMPKDELTRAQAAKILCSVLGKIN